MDERTIARFLSKVDKRGPDECWPWVGRLQKEGYGTFYDRVSKTYVLAHRALLEHALGVSLGRQIFACHSCDNPPCCNLRHLFPGTRQDNVDDMVSKGRSQTCGYFVRGERHARAKFNDATVADVLAFKDSGISAREVAERFGMSVNLVRHYWRNNGRTGPKQVRYRKNDVHRRPRGRPPSNTRSLPR